MTQYSIRPKRTTIRAQAVYFIQSTYFQFPIQYAFLLYIGRQAAPALWRTKSVILICNIEHWMLPKIWVGMFPFPVQSVQLRGKTWN